MRRTSRRHPGDAGDLDLADPRLPLNADLEGLPAALIECGSDELFLNEGRETRRASGPPGTRRRSGSTRNAHYFQADAGTLEEAETRGRADGRRG